MAITTHHFSGSSVVKGQYQADTGHQATRVKSLNGQYGYSFTFTYDDVAKKIKVSSMDVEVNIGNETLGEARFRMYIRGLIAPGAPYGYFKEVAYARSDYWIEVISPTTITNMTPRGTGGDFTFQTHTGPFDVKGFEVYGLITTAGDKSVFNAPFFSSIDSEYIKSPAIGGTVEMNGSGKPVNESADYMGTFLFNRPPNASTIPNQSTTAIANKTINLSSYFSDPDGDALTFAASSSDTGVCTVSVSGSTLTLRPVALGSTTITVTGNDGKGGTKSTTFTFSVVNSAPTVLLTSPSANQTLYENDVFNHTC